VVPGVGQQLCTISTLKVYLRFEFFTAVTMKNGVFWDVTLVRTDVSEELSAFCKVLLRSVRRLLDTTSVVLVHRF
jgi:hypothetical protein